MSLISYGLRIAMPAVVWFVFAPDVLAQLQFSELAKYALPTHSNSTSAVAVGDVDGDGDPDLIVGNYVFVSGDQNRLYLNDGTGVFADVTTTHLPPGFAGASVVGDVDGDGDLDAISTSGLCLNGGTGVFTDVTTSHLPAGFSNYASAVTLGDVDNDGDLDAMVATTGYSEPASSCCEWCYRDIPVPNRLYLNQGTGVFAEAASQLPNIASWTSSIALRDVDRDGDLDAVIGNGEHRDVWTPYWECEQISGFGGNDLYLNDGAGFFTSARAQLGYPSSTDTSSVALGDVDGDGDPDIVFGNRYEQNQLYLNDGSGVFVRSARLPRDSAGTQAVAIGDTDSDGDLDLVFGNWGSRQNQLYLNDGTGTFTDESAARMPPNGDSTAAVALADVDSDGDPDLVLGNLRQNRLFLNLFRQLDAPLEVGLGQPYQLDAYARYGPTGTVDTAVPFISTGAASIPVPPLGTFALDPAQMIRLPAFIIQQPEGMTSTSFVVPDLPALVGVSIYAQAVIVQYPVEHRLTNWTADVIVQ